MYEQTLWQDHVTEFEDRYTESRNDDGTITHTPVEGEIIQQGTPQNATNFNHMENGISNATEVAALMALSAVHHQQAIADLQGETKTVTLKIRSHTRSIIPNSPWHWQQKETTWTTPWTQKLWTIRAVFRVTLLFQTSC